jgi:alpha-L-fucosidase 2
MQSSADNEILLLPALPAALGTGYVKGLRARGGVTVSLAFSEGTLEKAEFTLDSHLPKQSFSVFYKNQEYKLDLEAGATEVICPPVKK